MQFGADEAEPTLQPRALDEELNRIRACGGVGPGPGFGERQRLQCVDLLATNLQRFAAARQNANIRRRPQQRIGELRARFDQMFAIVQQQQEPVRARIDVKEDDKNYMVHAEIPGVKKEDIQVSIDGNQVSISAEVKRQKEDRQGEKLLRSERYYGKVYRAFGLAQDVDQEKAQAKYENGVLELTLPKKAAAARKAITIQ